MVQFQSIDHFYHFFRQHSTEAACLTKEVVGFLQDHRQGSSFTLLDFGCGDGAFLQGVLTKLADPSYKIILHDVSPVYVDSATKKTAPLCAQVTHVDVVEDLSVKVELDVVLCNHSLYYVPDQKAALQGLWKSLRPEGYLLISYASSENALMAILRKMMAKMNDLPAQFFPEDLQATFESMQLEVSAKREIRSQFRCKDTEKNRMSFLSFVAVTDFSISHRHLDLSFLDPYSHDGMLDIPMFDYLYIFKKPQS